MTSERALPRDFTQTLLNCLPNERGGFETAQDALILLEQRQFRSAAAAFDALPNRNGASVWTLVCAGYCHLAVGNLDDALHFLQTATHRDARCGIAHYCLGLAWYKNGEKEMAADSFSAARRLLPELAAAAAYEATALFELSKFAESLELLTGLLQKYPQDPDLLNQTGLVLLRGFGKAREALEMFRRSKQFGTDNIYDYRSNEALALRCLGEYDESIQLYDELIDGHDTPYLRWQRCLALLSAQQFSRAWPDYRLRWLMPDSRKHSFVFPAWEPPSVPAETILVLSEQGIGDQILFASCLPDLIEQAEQVAAQVVVECNEKLEQLFRRSFPKSRIVARHRADDLQLARNLPQQNCRQIFLGDLPGLYRRDAGDFPPHHSFLRADPLRVAFWRTKLAKLGAGAKVGISWRGGLAHTNALLRSVGLDEWLPIIRHADCHFVSLQYGDVEADLSAQKKNGVAIQSWREANENYDETAALVASLDCVVSVCTSLVHLAGALGKPTAVLVPAVPEWVFAGAGDTMPWYPSVVLFRQAQVGDWGEPIERIAARLPDLARQTSRSTPYSSCLVLHRSAY